jgi:hypothetical protein
MSSNVGHEGKRSFWSGKVRTLCGITFEPGEAEYRWLSGVTCPACKAAKKAGKRL